MSDTRYTHDDPPWIDQRLDDGFWDDRDMRIWYMNWLGDLLGYSEPKDWYQIRVKDFEDNYGGNLLYRYYRKKMNAVHDLFPDYDWKFWQFDPVPDGYWGNLARQREYTDWLGEKLGYTKPEDWYGISRKKFKDNGGDSLLVYYDNSPVKAVLTLYPEYGLLPWKFNRTPSGFWHDNKNIRAYLEWLGEELGFAGPEDWYKISSRLLKDNNGTSLLGNIWRGRPSQAAYFLFPDYDWNPDLFNEWGFNKYPAGRERKQRPPAWSVAKNCIEYLDRLGRKLGYTKPEDWYGVRKEDFVENDGTGLMKYSNGYQKAIMQSYPDFDWKPWLFCQAPDGYWKEWKNRRACVDWLGERLDLKSREDWYQVSQSDFQKNMCGGLLAYLNASIRMIVKDAYPEYEWLQWKFHATSGQFWEDRENRKRYLKWLGQELGFVNPEDWYKVTQQAFLDNHGGGLINHYYQGIPLNAVKELFPKYEWKPWLFAKVPRGFWQNDDDCRQYMLWLEKELGYEKPEHWYRVKRPDFSRNHGGGLMTRLSSPLVAVMYLYPDFPWEPEKFRRGMRAQKKLLDRVMKLYPVNIAKFNYMHPEMRFLGSNWKMELDVFLPELSLAFEYQGEGHYKPVSIWGGEDGLKAVKALDEQKRRACVEKNITLIEIPYWWDGSEAELEKMIEAGPGPARPSGE